MVQQVRASLCKHEGLSSNLPHRVRDWAEFRVPVTSALSGGDRWLPKACWPVSLAQKLSFWFNEETVLQGNKGRATEEYT